MESRLGVGDLPPHQRPHSQFCGGGEGLGSQGEVAALIRPEEGSAENWGWSRWGGTGKEWRRCLPFIHGEKGQLSFPFTLHV